MLEPHLQILLQIAYDELSHEGKLAVVADGITISIDTGGAGTRRTTMKTDPMQEAVRPCCRIDPKSS